MEKVIRFTVIKVCTVSVFLISRSQKLPWYCWLFFTFIHLVIDVHFVFALVIDIHYFFASAISSPLSKKNSTSFSLPEMQVTQSVLLSPSLECKYVNHWQEFNINCYKPGNGETAHIAVSSNLEVEVSLSLLKHTMAAAAAAATTPPTLPLAPSTSGKPEDQPNKKQKVLHGVLIMKNNVSGGCDGWSLHSCASAFLFCVMLSLLVISAGDTNLHMLIFVSPLYCVYGIFSIAQ